LNALERTMRRNEEFDPTSTEREFRIAASDYALLVLVQPLVERLSKTAPRIRLFLRLADTQAQRRLASGDIDLAIQPAGLVHNLPSQHLFTDRLVCGERLTLEQWSSLPHATFGIGREGRNLADPQLGRLAAQRTRTLICESILALPMMLHGTSLIALVPEKLGLRVSTTADLKLVAPPHDLPEFSQTMSWSPLMTDDPGHAWLRSALTDVASEL
jgi:LysR family transcriptional regulator, nod-box dependent transcriptional activator